MQFESLPEFDKDVKRLLKRFRSLEADLETLQKYLAVAPQASPPNIKKFACRALKGRGANSGIRIIYALHAEKQKIVFIEMYFKGDKENEDRSRIVRTFSA